jgi:hypothetical protein
VYEKFVELWFIVLPLGVSDVPDIVHCNDAG